MYGALGKNSSQRTSSAATLGVHPLADQPHPGPRAEGVIGAQARHVGREEPARPPRVVGDVDLAAAAREAQQQVVGGADVARQAQRAAVAETVVGEVDLVAQVADQRQVREDLPRLDVDLGVELRVAEGLLDPPPLSRLTLEANEGVELRVEPHRRAEGPVEQSAGRILVAPAGGRDAQPRHRLVLRAEGVADFLVGLAVTHLWQQAVFGTEFVA